MASIVRWITGRDERPPASLHSHSSNSGSRLSTMIVRREETSPRTIIRSPIGPNSVTYACKDEKRNAQFICHLPAGSEHAPQAQKIAASMYSGKPAEGNIRGNKLLGDSGSTLFLEDDSGRTRRERSDIEYLSVDGGMKGTANRSVTSRASVSRAPILNEQYPSSDDEEPESVPPISRRSTLSSTTTRYYASDGGHTILEVETSEFGDRSEDLHHSRESVAAAPMGYPDASSVRAASTAMTSATGVVGSSISRAMTTTSRNSRASGFRHQSDTHTTYNIKNREDGRQLFVSAPIGSREAAIHDQVVMKAATSGSKAAWIEDSGAPRGTVSRRKWVGD